MIMGKNGGMRHSGRVGGKRSMARNGRPVKTYK